MRDYGAPSAQPAREQPDRPMGDAQLGRWPSQCGGQDLVTDLIGERGPRRWLSRPVLQTGQAMLSEPATTPRSVPCTPPARRSAAQSSPGRTTARSALVAHPEPAHHDREYAAPAPPDQTPEPPECAPDSACTIISPPHRTLNADTHHDTTWPMRGQRSGGHVRRRRITLLAAVPLMAGIAIFGSAAAEVATPSDNASCNAQYVHENPGPPGQHQREAHEQAFGQKVSTVAHTPADMPPEPQVGSRHY
jgi:hypothetical protein